jgi:hypothetical protein
MIPRREGTGSVPPAVLACCIIYQRTQRTLPVATFPVSAPCQGLEASPALFGGDRADGKEFFVELQKLAEQARELASA